MSAASSDHVFTPENAFCRTIRCAITNCQLFGQAGRQTSETFRCALDMLDHLCPPEWGETVPPTTVFSCLVDFVLKNREIWKQEPAFWILLQAAHIALCHMQSFPDPDTPPTQPCSPAEKEEKRRVVGSSIYSATAAVLTATNEEDETVALRNYKHTAAVVVKDEDHEEEELSDKMDEGDDDDDDESIDEDAQDDGDLTRSTFFSPVRRRGTLDIHRVPDAPKAKKFHSFFEH